MELVHNYQISLEELFNERIDYFITASGNQKRSTFLAENINLNNAKKLFLNTEKDSNHRITKENEKVFEKLGFSSFGTISDERKEVEQLLNSICREKPSSNMNILIDYSCMTKPCYASIVDFLVRNEPNHERINMFFSYTPKQINALPSKPKCKSVDFLFNYNVKENDKQNALVVGLNSNAEPTKEIIKKFQSVKTIIFIPEINHDSAYHNALYDFNKEILRNTPQENFFKYPAECPDQIASMLTSICLDLRLKHNVILVPQGPKTFALASILLTTRYPDIKLMHVNAVEKFPNDDGLPAGRPVIVKSVFYSDDEPDD